ncbi:MAG TPA: hypothetical protein VLW45_06185 [Pelomicrobium sp.]|nr:hypothetical protein [Pelomicrobium sp.]
MVLAAALASGCAEAIREAQPMPAELPVLSRLQTINGGFLATDVGPTGMPRRPGAGPYTRIVFPTAVSVSGSDVVIVDSGANTVYRFDAGLNALVPLRGAPAIAGVQVAIGGDLSIYVMDPNTARVLRFGRDGQLIRTYTNPQLLNRPIGFALRESRGELVFADAVTQQVVSLSTLGGSGFAVSPRLDPVLRIADVTAIAANDDHVCLSDRATATIRCIGRDGRQTAAFAAPTLAVPGPLAIDRDGHVFAVDLASGRLNVFSADGRVSVLTPAQLGITRLAGLGVGTSQLAVADSAGGQVVLFQLRGGGG